MSTIKNRVLLPILLSFLIIFLGIQNVAAFNFTFKNISYSISDKQKERVDIFVSKNCNSEEKVTKYLNALQKISYSKLSSEKQKIFSYLVYKLDSLYFTGADSSLLKALASSTAGYIPVNDDYTFFKDGKEFLLKINFYYVVDFSVPSSTYLKIPNLNKEVLFKKGGNYLISKGGYVFEKKTTINDLKSKVLFFSQSEDPVLFKNFSDYYYAISLYEYQYFEIPSSGIFLSQYNNVELKDLSKVILLYKKGKYLLVFNFSPKKLFKESTLASINNKDAFLSFIGKDFYFYKDTDWDSILSNIKTKSLELTNSHKTKDDKIFAIYSWIVKNIKYDPFSYDFVRGKMSEVSYTKSVDNNVFTGIGAYKNKVAVCDGFTKLFFYMAYFSGLEDTEIQTGEAILSNGRSSHAWIKIGNYYYDPTWDSNISSNSSFEWYKLSYEEISKTHKLGSN